MFRTPGWETVICSFCCPVNFPKAQAVKRNNDFLTVPLFLPKPNLLFLLFPSIFSRRRLKKNKAFHDFLFIEKKFRQNNFKCSHSQAGTQTDDFFFGFFPEVFPKHGLEKTNSELCFFDFSLSISELHRTPEPFVGCKTESSFVKSLCFYCFVLGRQTARQQGSGVYKAQMFCPCFRSFRTGRLPKKIVTAPFLYKKMVLSQFFFPRFPPGFCSEKNSDSIIFL